METVELPVDDLREAAWNTNRMDEAMTARLRSSVVRFGLVLNLVVRPIGGDTYEVLSGNQRLKVLSELGIKTAPCIVVRLDDANAMLLAQALNRIQGEDDLGLRAEVVRKVMAELPRAEVLAVLPEAAGSLSALASMGKANMAAYLENWQRAQAARLRHLVFQLTDAQKRTVEEALAMLLPRAKQADTDSPNARGTALYLLCKSYLESEAMNEHQCK